MRRDRWARLHLLMEGEGKQFVVVTSRRVGNAVKRNRARRIFGEAIRLLMTDIKPGTRGAFVLRPEAATASLAQARACVQELLAACEALDAD